MKITQDIKDRVQFDIRSGTTYETIGGAEVDFVKDDSARDGTVMVRMLLGEQGGWWVGVEDCLELSVFFKKLAKKLQEANAGS